MTNDSLDLEITRHLKQAGLATEEQIQEAIRAKDASTTTGTPRSLSDILIEKGILTSVQRDNIEKKLQEHQDGGKKLLHYKLIRKLGEGGMGAVYLADDTELNRKVAVKVLPKKSGANAEFLNRFRREAEAAAALDHPNIAGAYATGSDQGYHFYVMEYCEGETVDKILRRDRTLDPIRATDLVLQVARGLECAHGKGFVHRDIKPSNVLLMTNGVAKILDLGLTKNLAEGELAFRTVTGVALGTPHYISPEQAMGDRKLDGRADIYSLGASFYHFVTGRPPFEGPSAMEVMSQQVHAQVPNPQDLKDDIPESVVHVIRKMMAKKPDDRYRDCTHLISDLEEVAAGRAPKTQVLDAALSAVAPLRRRSSPEATGRRRAVTVRRAIAGRHAARPSAAPWILAAAAVIVVAIAAFFLLRGDDPAPRPPAPRSTDTGPVPPTPAPKPSPRRTTTPAKKPAPPPSSAKEEEAQQALARLTRFEGLAEDDVDGRAALLTRFIATHPRSFAAAQARAMIGQLKNSIRPGPVDERFVKAVSVLPLLDQISQVVKKLQELNPGYDGNKQHRTGNRKVTGLVLQAKEIKDITPLQALPGLEQLVLKGTGVTDLSALNGLTLRELQIGRTGVADLSPLRGMPLVALNCGGTVVDDLSPLSGMRLRSLSVNGTAVRDLTPLQGMPLAYLDCSVTPVTDLSPIAQCPLVELVCPFDPDRDAKILLKISTLRRINGLPAADFWKRHGLTPPTPPAPPARAVPLPGGVKPWPEAIDLLALIDPVQDTVNGSWRKGDQGLQADDDDFSRIRIPYRPPEEYDFRIVFTRNEGGCSTNQILWKEGRHFQWHMGNKGNEWCGFSLIKDQEVDENPTGVEKDPSLEDDRTYTSVVRVRNEGVTALLDGRKMAEWKTGYSDFSIESEWSLPMEGILGLGSCNNKMIFHLVELKEVTGIGAPLRLGPWRQLFDGKTLDFLTKRGEGSWQVRDGALVQRRGLRQNAAQTIEAFGDGQIRFRFEVDSVEFASFTVRQGDGDGAEIRINKKRIAALNPGLHEVLFTCRGDRVGAHLNGQAVPVRMNGKPRTGRIQFNAVKGTFRVKTVEFRPLQ